MINFINFCCCYLYIRLLIRNWFIRWITGSSAQSTDYDYEYGSDDEDEEDKDREEKKTIKERLQTIQEVSQSVQNTIGHIASLGESVKKYVMIISIIHYIFFSSC